MQKKTIHKIIATKLNEWLSSIEDKTLAADVKKNIVLSGGSIASMFLNTEVNDFDIYLQDVDVLYRLAKYYCDPLRVEVFHGKKKEEYIKKDYEESGRSLYASFARNLQEDQVKLIVNNGNTAGARFNEELGDKKFVPIYISPNSISLSDKIQIVLRFTGDAAKIHSTFDFIHATNYFTFVGGVVTNLAAMESLISKQLKYQGSKYPITSVIRMRKFIKRGWNISSGDILKMALQISRLDLNEPDTLEEQLVGVDVAYFDKLIAIIREGDKDKIAENPHYVETIIDRVFSSLDTESDEFE